MNVQPKPSKSPPAIDHMTAERAAPGARHSTIHADAVPRGRVLVAGPRLLYTWPVEFEVEPWRP